MRSDSIGASRLQIVRYIGQFLIMIGVICLLPLIILPFYPKEYKELPYFLGPGLGSILFGSIISILLRSVQQNKLRKNQDAILIVMIWFNTIIICGLPFALHDNWTFSQGVFEAMSGFSTTGLTTTNVDITSHLYLFYRSITQVVGGVGLVLVFTSVLSDSHGLRLYTAEGHNDRLLANLAKSGKLMVGIYGLYIAVGCIAYLICGMSFFDAINHSMCAVATGGFSTHGESIEYFHSVGVEVITIILMILGSTNFVIHFFLLTGKLKKVWHHCETKLFVALFIVFVPLMVMSLMFKIDMSFGKSLRATVFQYISALTGTGYQNMPYSNLPDNFIMFMVIAMLIGGGAGSTAGAIKQYRVCLLLKSMYWDITDKSYSHRVIKPKYINRYDQRVLVTDEDRHDNNIYIIMYLLLFLIGTLIYSCYYPLLDSIFTFASCLGTVGLAYGKVDFIVANNTILWSSTIAMFLGRLEIIVIFVAIARNIKERDVRM